VATTGPGMNDGPEKFTWLAASLSAKEKDVSF
jgi:hypothetical protein